MFAVLLYFVSCIREDVATDASVIERLRVTATHSCTSNLQLAECLPAFQQTVDGLCLTSSDTTLLSSSFFSNRHYDISENK